MLFIEKIIDLAKYLNIKDVFSKTFAIELFKHMNINEYIIKPKKSKELCYRLIYNFELIELKIVKTYIKTNLTNSSNKLFKSSAKAFILFVKKSNYSFRLYINYQGLNNLIIKN